MRQTATMFAENRHLDDKPYDEKGLVSVRCTTDPDKPAPRPSLEWMLAVGRRLRKEELEVPVVQVEVHLLDVMREKRYWNLTPSQLEEAASSEDFAAMRQAADARGFSTSFDAHVFHNAFGQLRVSLKFVFHRREMHQGRTYTEAVRP